jgi:hypothetical protein
VRHARRRRLSLPDEVTWIGKAVLLRLETTRDGGFGVECVNISRLRVSAMRLVLLPPLSSAFRVLPGRCLDRTTAWPPPALSRLNRACTTGSDAYRSSSNLIARTRLNTAPAAQ